MAPQPTIQSSFSKTVDRIVIYFVTAILTILGSAKILMLITNFNEFREINAFLSPLPNWIIACFGIIVEAIVVCQIIRRRQQPGSAGLWILWFSVLIGFYRAGLYLVSPHSKCHCLGLFSIFFRTGSLRENHVSIAVLIIIGLAGFYLYFKSLLGKHPPTQLIVFLFIFLPVAAFSSESAVKITGSLTFEYYNKEGKKINLALSRFEVFRNNIGWRIIAHQPPSDEYSSTSDGNCSFSTISSTNEAQNLDSAFIDFGNVPVASPSVNIPWWFYVLSKNLDIKGNGLTSPWLLSRFDPQAFFCTARIKWADSDPNLISKATFAYSSNLVMKASFSSPVSREFELPSGLTQQLMTDLARKMPSEAIPAGLCEVLSWTNTPFGRYPKQFQLVVYSSLSEQEQGDGQITRIRINGEMADISSAEYVDYMPPLTRQIYVRDFRFRVPSNNVEYVEYGPTKHWATNMADVNLATLRKTVKTGVQFNPAENKNKIKIVFILLLCTTLFPILVVLLRRGNKQKTNK